MRGWEISLCKGCHCPPPGLAAEGQPSQPSRCLTSEQTHVLWDRHRLRNSLPQDGDWRAGRGRPDPPLALLGAQLQRSSQETPVELPATGWPGRCEQVQPPTLPEENVGPAQPPNSSRSGHMVCVASGGRAGARQGLSDLRRRSGSRSVLGLHPGLCGPLPPIAPHLHTPGVVGHVPHEEGGVGRTEVARHGAGEGGGRGEEPDRRRDDPPASRPQPLRKPPQIRPPCGPTLARPPLKSTPS